MDIVLDIEDLNVTYRTPTRPIPAVRGVTINLNEKEVLGIVGESGSGKSTLALSIAQLLPSNAIVRAKKFNVLGIDITRRENKRLVEKLRGTGVYMVFQDPFSSLNPLMKIKDQLLEAYKTRFGKSNADPKVLAEYLSRVNLPDPLNLLERYPHQLSGGQIQRIMIAMALILEPKILIADEPTTALDVITQAQILSELKGLVNKLSTSMIFITHDIAVAGIISTRLAVMYGGMIMEIGPTNEILTKPLHPYTQGLISSLPSLKKSKREGELSEIKGMYTYEESGCPFASRCPYVTDKCKKETPPLIKINNRYVRCHIYGQ